MEDIVACHHLECACQFEVDSLIKKEMIED